MSSPANEQGSIDSKRQRAIQAALERELESIPVFGAPPAIPDHELLERIGIGAYGEVWRARNVLGMFRAVKIVYRARFEDEKPYARELHGILKYEPMSRSHEGLVQILHVGRNDEAGYFYYVMELADDANAIRPGIIIPQTGASQPTSSGAYKPRTLRCGVTGGRWGLHEAALLGLRLVEALGHLHSHGLVHRDVKPSNVIFVNNQPKLADLGLVTGAGDSLSFVGTEGFIPPEGPGTAQADLYSLGKLLYELATGRDRREFPQLGVDVGGPAPARELLEFNEVLLRACAPNPRERYQSAEHLKADLSLFLGGRSLREARMNQQNLARLRWVGVGLALLLAVGTVALWVSRTRERAANARERLAAGNARIQVSLRRRAERAELEARGQLYSALAEQATALVQSRQLGQRVRALEAVQRAAAISNAPELRASAFAALALPDLRLRYQFPISPDVTCIVMDPQFERLAWCTQGRPVEIRSPDNQRLLSTLPVGSDQIPDGCYWSHDGRFIALKMANAAPDTPSYFEVWDVPATNRVLKIERAKPGAIAFHPSLAMVLAALPGNSVGIWDLEHPEAPVSRFGVSQNPVLVSISPDGERFAVGSAEDVNSVVAIFRMRDGQPVSSCVFQGIIGGLSWHPSGNQLAVGDHSGCVSLMDARSGTAKTLGHHKAQAVCTVFSPDGRYLISGGWERELIAWAIPSKRRLFNIDLGSFTAAFSADGKQFATPSRLTENIHEFLSPSACRELPEDLGGWVRHARFSANGRWLTAAGQAKVGAWDLQSSGPAAVIDDDRAKGAQPALSEDGQQLFIGSDNECSIWSVSSGRSAWDAPRLIADPETFKAFGSFTVISNQVILTYSGGSQVLRRADKSSASAKGDTGSGIGAASPDGNWLGIYQPFSPYLKIFEMPGFRQVTILTNQANILDFSFSPESDQVAVCSGDHIQLFSTTTWQPVRQLPGFMGLIFVPGSHSYWLTKDYRNGGLYDARTLDILLPLPPDTLPLALSRDGTKLVVSVESSRLQVWDLPLLHESFRELGVDWPAER